MIITIDGWNGSGKTTQLNALHERYGVVHNNYFKTQQDREFIPFFDARNDLPEEHKQYFDMCFGRLMKLVVWKSKCSSYGGHVAIEHFYSDALDVIMHFEWTADVRLFVFDMFDRLIDIFFPRERLRSFYLDVPVSRLSERRAYEKYSGRLQYEDKWLACWRHLEAKERVIWIDGTLPINHITDLISEACGFE